MDTYRAIMNYHHDMRSAVSSVPVDNSNAHGGCSRRTLNFVQLVCPKRNTMLMLRFLWNCLCARRVFSTPLPAVCKKREHGCAASDCSTLLQTNCTKKSICTGVLGHSVFPFMNSLAKLLRLLRMRTASHRHSLFSGVCRRHS